MFSGLLKFSELPQIGFAHHFYTENYSVEYGSPNKSFEIVYVVSGDILVELHNRQFTVKQGSVFVLFRHLPIKLSTVGNCPQAHCTVQAELDFDFELISEDGDTDIGGVILPFVVEPGAEAEKIKTSLYSIISAIGTDREKNSLSASLTLISIMQQLDSLARKRIGKKNSSQSIISHRIKKYVARNIGNKITLSDIAKELSKTPNYINAAFKEANGTTIQQYIANERVRRIADLMQTQNLSFKTACENAAIYDVSYGYRLFKKHTGITPGEFSNGETIKK